MRSQIQTNRTSYGPFFPALWAGHRPLLGILIGSSRCLLQLWSVGVRAVFKWLSKVITWLRLLPLEIGLKESRQFFDQWEAKPNPIAPCTRDFYRASSELQVIVMLGIVIGSSRCLLLLWLVWVIALVSVFRQSFENRSITLVLLFRLSFGNSSIVNWFDLNIFEWLGA